MKRLILAGEPPVEVTLRISARAKRLSLRVSQLDGSVSLTLPRRVSMREAQAFLGERAEWVRKHVAATPAQVRLAPGGEVPFAGRAHRLVASGGRAARLGDGVITLPLGAPEKTGPRVAALFKALARDRLDAASMRHAAALGRSYTGLTLRDTRSRWGSCSPEGRLMYSWRLVMAPPEVLDYVAAHEVAHLAEMNHSAPFWAHVARLMPDYAKHRQLLRKNGVKLHAYRFRD
ncbi:MAG TPA: M48 family peptidase [Aliiroseovarius sp.]|nr:M48 family peptidase [Aliiroseovarius sp.]